VVQALLSPQDVVALCVDLAVFFVYDSAIRVRSFPNAAILPGIE
jgi:hypothetical protein